MPAVERSCKRLEILCAASGHHDAQGPKLHAEYPLPAAKEDARVALVLFDPGADKSPTWSAFSQCDKGVAGSIKFAL
ncbi:hypothetical protein GCM10009530_75060 [Microbispora corallina]|uniref:Uncharacterized protein n=1 Tax=Microbispora corallina TaxID=83302 RepID=A0ABQ4GBD8_9ACTN|nr:hypothetical protein Mco01_74050 [Microbispora corallina]